MTIDLNRHTLLTPEEASAFLRCSKRTLARWRSEGVGPRYHRRGARILYSAAALLTWLEQTIEIPVRCDAPVPSGREGGRIDPDRLFRR